MRKVTSKWQIQYKNTSEAGPFTMNFIQGRLGLKICPSLRDKN
jgi:hypothetical protein